jgi:glycosyltransferase involved in cell wall biosynthesis
LHLRRRFDVVHVHNMPDILVLSGLFARLTGARMILDLHDPMPEVYMTKYGIAETHPVIRVLIGLERFSIWMANLVLTPNIAFREIFIRRGCPPSKVEIVMNSPDLRVFGAGVSPAPSRAPDAGGAFLLMYHGTVVERHGLDTALHAVALLRDEIPGLHFHVFGGGDFVEAFLELRTALGLEDFVTYHGWVPLETVAAFVPQVDLGLVPNKRSVFTEINLPTRLFEYLCLGRPVVAPETKGIRDYFPSDALYYFEPGDAASLAAVILRARNEPEEREAIVRRGRAVYLRHQWPEQRDHLVALVRQLVHREPVAISVKGD